MSQLVKRFSKRSLVITGALLSMCCISNLYWVDPSSLYAIYAIIFFNQLSKGIAASSLWGLVADTADYVEWKSGRRVVGLSTSSATFSHKFGMGLSGALVGIGLSFAGYQAGVEQTAQSAQMILLFMSLFPAFGAGCIAFIAYFYPITRNVEDTMQSELRATRKANQVN